MVEGRAKRKSRGPRPQSYRFEEVYSFLDSEEDSRSSGPEDAATQQEDEENNVDSFMPNNEEEEEQEDEPTEDESEEEDKEEEEEQQEDEHDAHDDVLIVNEDIISKRPIKKRVVRKVAKPINEPDAEVPRELRRKTTWTTAVATGSGTLARALLEPYKRYVAVQTDEEKRERRVPAHFMGGHESRLRDLFGSGSDDIAGILNTKEKWLSRDPLPSRPNGTVQRSFFESPGAREKEAGVLSKWYAGFGRKAFAAGQKSRTLNENEARPYMSNHGPNSLNLLAGSLHDPQVHTLKKGTHMSSSAPFAEKSSRQGWIMNLGTRVEDAQWIVNEEGKTQYLAVAVEQRQRTGRRHKPLENPKAPAFTKTHGFPGSIQIWAFASTESGALDSITPPRLDLVICTDWGAPKHFRWCPVRIENPAEEENEDNVHLGLLAGHWSDGKVRVLDVSFRRPDAGSPKTQFIHYSRASFEASFSDSVPSCVHWLSGSSIAVATAGGSLSIWILTRPGMFPSPEDAHKEAQYSPQPWFFKQVANTYVLSLASGWPSRPQYVSITIADGSCRLMDLRSPDLDTVYSPRGRMLVRAQAWHEQSQCFLTADEYYLLKSSSLRRYFRVFYSMRNLGSISCCATSPVHASVLIGGVDGNVTSGNPMVKALHVRDAPWQQVWFKHEWRQPVEKLAMSVRGYNTDDDDVSGEEDASVQEDEHRTKEVPRSLLEQPMARMTEGYKATQPGLQYGNLSAGSLDGPKLLTIHEDKSAVSALAWNPNLRFGTWAVAGMADGLLRVEDLSVDQD